MRELLGTCEAIGESTPFLYLFAIWKEDGELYCAKTDKIRMAKFTDADLDAFPRGDPIPREHYFPIGSWGRTIDMGFTLTEAPTPPPQNIFIKHPCYINYIHGGSIVADQLLIEAKILERLAKNPHPNIVHYHGCVREGNFVTGICLKWYGSTLEDVVKDNRNRSLMHGHGQVSMSSISQAPDSDAYHDGWTRKRKSIMDGLVNGAKHLHAMGLVHNDINPRNVMLDVDSDDGRLVPVIIDFDLCLAEGTPECSPGTSTWGRPGAHLEPCTRRNDLYAIGLLGRFMEGRYDGDVYEYNEVVLGEEDVLVSGLDIDTHRMALCVDLYVSFELIG